METKEKLSFKNTVLILKALSTTLVVFSLFLLADQITVIFTHLKLWVAVATHNFKWVKI